MFIPKLSIGIETTSDFSLIFDWKELKMHSDEVLNLFKIIGKNKGIKFIICLDEFQNLSSFNEYIEYEKNIRLLATT